MGNGIEKRTQSMNEVLAKCMDGSLTTDFFNTKQRLIWDPGRKVQGEPQRGTAQGEGVPWAHEGLEGITIPKLSAKSERNFKLECNNWMPGQPMGKLGKQ